MKKQKKKKLNLRELKAVKIVAAILAVVTVAAFSVSLFKPSSVGGGGGSGGGGGGSSSGGSSTDVPGTSLDNPIYANSIEECVDTSKYYVLPDGYIYTYQAKEVFYEHNANDGTGYIDKIPSSTWGNSYTSMPGVWTSPLISIDPNIMGLGGATNVYQTNVTISGMEKIVPAYNGFAVVVYYYKQDGSLLFMKANKDFSSINAAQYEEIAAPSLRVKVNGAAISSY